jgi:hypothetical protein
MDNKKNKSTYEDILNIAVYKIYIDFLNSVTQKTIEDAKRKENKNGYRTGLYL